MFSQDDADKLLAEIGLFNWHSALDRAINEWGWSEEKIRAVLDHLQKENLVSISVEGEDDGGVHDRYKYN